MDFSSTLSVVTTVMTLLGTVLMPLGLARILFGAFASSRRSEKVKSGMNLMSLGLFLLVAGILVQP